MADFPHESFWVVIGTATPVIELAVAVSFSQAIDGIRRPWRPLPPRKWTSRFLEVRKQLHAAWSPAARAYWASAAAFLLNLVLFQMSLQSLASGRDELTPDLAGGLMLVSVALLMFQAFLFEEARRSEERRRVSGKDE